jgi:hypothetical protein
MSVPERAAPAVFNRSTERGIFQKGNHLFLAVFYRSAEHHVV